MGDGGVREMGKGKTYHVETVNTFLESYPRGEAIVYARTCDELIGVCEHVPQVLDGGGLSLAVGNFNGTHPRTVLSYSSDVVCPCSFKLSKTRQVREGVS
jgi:hypothetical protein